MMLTIEEIESSCNSSAALEFSRQDDLAAPELSLRRVFYPFGFPTEVRTNSPEVLRQFELLWTVFSQRFDTKLIQVDVHVVESDARECPPAPTYRQIDPLMVTVADSENYIICDLAQGKTQVVISRTTVKHPLYLRYFFLEPTVGCHIATRFTTPVHAACVALNGCGVLLLGDSGAGKSSLAYACARAGWTYVTDDASFLLNGGRERMVIGNCHQLRFRPSAGELFPEVNRLPITPRAAGKPSVVVPTATMSHLSCEQTAHVDYLVFLNRRSSGPPELVPYRKEVARGFMQQVLFGLPEVIAEQCEAIERLLTAEVLELRYSQLDWATERLEALARDRQ
jgi:HPr Serine kinase C-terminal domain